MVKEISFLFKNSIINYKMYLKIGAEQPCGSKNASSSVCIFTFSWKQKLLFGDTTVSQSPPQAPIFFEGFFGLTVKMRRKSSEKFYCNYERRPRANLETIVGELRETRSGPTYLFTRWKTS